jgi:hypothetical protein
MSKTILHATLLGIAPWLTFVLMIVLMFEFWHAYTVLTLAAIITLFVIFVAFAIFETHHGKKWLYWLGVLCFVALLAGTAVGIFNYYSLMLYFYSYSDLRKYTNVAGSQHAAGFEDAGMILFTKGSGVDTTAAVGMQDPSAAGTVFCVAPIIDGSMTKSDLISFWAVGENCCEERANFQCDGAGNYAAKSGLVVLEVEKLVTQAVASVISDAGANRNMQYRNAIRLQNAVFGTGSAKEIVLVHWTKDPVARQDEYWQEAFANCVTECAVYFVLSIIMGISAAMQARPPPKTLY